MNSDNMKAAHIAELDLKTELTVLVAEMFQSSSQSVDKANTTFIVKEFAKDIYERFNYFDLCEIKLACWSGLKGDYGDYKGINIVSINEWIKAYNNSEQRKRYIQKKINSQPQIEQKASMTDGEQYEFMKSACLKAFSDFKAGKLDGDKIFDMGSPKYDWLDKQGIIKFTTERKREIMAESEPEMREDILEQMRSTPNKRATFEVILNNTSCSDYQSKLISKAKQKALLLFFSELVETDQELSDIINQPN